MIVAGSGHRELGGVEAEAKLHFWVKEKLVEYEVERVITGMAWGFDMIIGLAAADLGIPITCAIPWKGHIPRSGHPRFYQYNAILDHADEVKFISEETKFPGNYIYQERNEWMVDLCDLVISAFSGTPGGTKNCLGYAKRVGCPYLYIDPATWEESRG